MWVKSGCGTQEHVGLRITHDVMLLIGPQESFVSALPCACKAFKFQNQMTKTVNDKSEILVNDGGNCRAHCSDTIWMPGRGLLEDVAAAD
jgi:hypothetical protein